MSDESTQPEDIPQLTGTSSDEVFSFLSATMLRRMAVETDDTTINTPLLPRLVRNEIIARLESEGWKVKAYPKGSTLEWHIRPQTQDTAEPIVEYVPEPQGMRYDDLVAASAIIGPIVGIIYGAIHGDVLHGFVVGIVVGWVPFMPILVCAPFILIWEKFFEKQGR